MSCAADLDDYSLLCIFSFFGPQDLARVGQVILIDYLSLYLRPKIACKVGLNMRQIVLKNIIYL